MQIRWNFALGISICIVLFCSPMAHARAAGVSQPSDRTRAASELNTRDPDVIRRAYQYPKIDSTRELKGEALIRALRKGGNVLYMRHTQTGNVTPECNASNLTAAGERDARFIGDSIRTLRIPVDRVLSSPICRVVDTAKLLDLGVVETKAELSNVSSASAPDLEVSRLANLLAKPAAGKNRLLVSHMQRGKTESDRLDLDFGEIIVFDSGKSPPLAVARVRADDWYDLIGIEKLNAGANNK